jgi:phosphatidylserine decarboxylase
VNPLFLSAVQNLFARNERLVFDIELRDGSFAYVIMVGAMNVGRIRARFLENFFTNAAPRLVDGEPKEFRLEQPIELKAGDELGTFLLGSTAICVFPTKVSKRYEFLQVNQKKKIKMGESLIIAGHQ